MEQSIKQSRKRMAVIFLFFGILLFFFLWNLNAHASGLVDDTINAGNEYSKYSIDHYQLDYYVDTDWNWLPWKWLKGIGDAVIYAIHILTNFIWMLSVNISKATGFAVQEAYRLDFISDMADSIGKNIQILTGISEKGISKNGFYYGFLTLFILIIGAYVAYVGLIKRETSKAIGSVTHFILVFVLSGALIASAPTLIKNINEFSKDVSTGALTAGTKIVMPNSGSEGRDSTDLIRDCLWGVQVKIPWMILQFGTTDVKASRVEKLLAANPFGITEDGEADSTREEIVKAEIEESGNFNLTNLKASSRLGVAFFIFIFNIIISVFVLFMTGYMILSQVLFIVYAMFLPFSFLFSTLPTYGNLSKKGIERFFNTIMSRAGITLIVTVAFSISTMFYNISSGYPFFLIAFLQIITFVGITMKMNDILSLFGLQSGDEQRIMNRMMRSPRMNARRVGRRVNRALSRGRRGMFAATVGGSAIGAGIAERVKNRAPMAGWKERDGKRGRLDDTGKTGQKETPKKDQKMKQNMGERVGQKVGNVMDTKEKMSGQARFLHEKAKSVPANTRYAVYKGKEQLQGGVNKVKDTVKDNVQGFKGSISDTRSNNSAKRAERLVNYQAKMEGRRDKVEQSVGAASKPERPLTSRMPERGEEGGKTHRSEPDQTYQAETGSLQQPTEKEKNTLVSSGFDAGKEEPHTKRRKGRKRRNKRNRRNNGVRGTS